MNNFRLFEFCDKAWAPNWYHKALHKYLIFFYKTFGYHKLWLDDLNEFIRNDKDNTFLECCSGSGDCLPLLVCELDDDKTKGKKFILTDLFPLEESIKRYKASKNFHYYNEPVDASNVPEELNYSRIFINSFHHLPPDVAKGVLQNSLKQNKNLLILEYVSQSWVAYFLMMLGPFILFTTLPFVLKGKNLVWTSLFTYIIPLFPIMLLWDGLVSCNRFYTKKDFENILGDDFKYFQFTESKRRSWLYPAGVSAITLQTNYSELSKVA
ncbi:MAG: hypothetical protein KDD58_02910 [Bdellovibrionales bacterium]|nr:hypothetical protein [Bdellovibrionales bacterium]